MRKRADWKSATQQVGNLGYAKRIPWICGGNEALSFPHLPAYFDGLRIRSSRSASNLFRASCPRLCRRATVTVCGSSQACLTRLASVRQISLIVYIKWVSSQAAGGFIALHQA